MIKLIYNLLPYLLKTIIASIAGIQRQRLRYGPNLELLVSDAFEREMWGPEPWAEYQKGRLTEILSIAYHDVPYYRHQWAERKRLGDDSDWQVLENWPILSKQIVRNDPKAFVRESIKLHSLHQDHTSGTSGSPLVLYQTVETIRNWYALFEARWRRWNGVDLKDKWAIFGGQLVVKASQSKPPYWVWNQGMRQLYCSSYHISADTISAYIQALIDHKVVYILGYASSLYSIAKLGLELGLTPPEVKLVLNNAEPLFEHQRETIEAFFRCKVRDTYGMSEMLCAASECDHGSMHVWPETGIFETGLNGELISTGLLNKDMPLIRYSTGDVVVFDKRKGCSCGRNLPLIKTVEGRSDDMILTKDGRQVGRLDPIFKTDLHIMEAQIIQESMDQFTIKVVPAADYCEKDTLLMSDGLKARVGDVDVNIELVDAIPRTSAGKFKAVISKVKDA